MLGNTGLKVSTLGFGSMLASDPSVLERAYDLGINYFDTARGYQRGNNERMVGAALKGKRDKVVLVTKAPATTKTEILEQLDTSLQELGTDYLDVWYIHNKSTPNEVKDELLEAQEIARKAGKIRFRGLSYHFNMPEMLEHTVKLGCIDVALLTYNFIVGDDVGNAIKKARATGLGIVGMKVMAGGYRRIQRGDRLYGQDKAELESKLRKPSAMLASLKYVLQNKSMDTAIVGMTDFEEVEEDVRAMSEPFTGDDEKLLAERRQDIQHLYCHACGQCSGVCEKGVRVADTQRQLMYAEGYGQFAMARECYLDQPALARSVSCEDCSTCSIQCPNGLDVRANLIRAQKLFG
jgi:predicted aldo/keto reductase-like oxidoreductase